jgi:hypothetical protein
MKLRGFGRDDVVHRYLPLPPLRSSAAPVEMTWFMGFTLAFRPLRFASVEMTWIDGLGSGI